MNRKQRCPNLFVHCRITLQGLEVLLAHPKHTLSSLDKEINDKSLNESWRCVQIWASQVWRGKQAACPEDVNSTPGKTMLRNWCFCCFPWGTQACSEVFSGVGAWCEPVCGAVLVQEAASIPEPKAASFSFFPCFLLSRLWSFLSAILHSFHRELLAWRSPLLWWADFSHLMSYWTPAEGDACHQVPSLRTVFL